MRRTLFAAVAAAGLAWTAAAAPPCNDHCTGSATIGTDGATLTLTGAEAAYRAVATKVFTLTIQNRTSTPVHVVLTNFKVREAAGDRPDCPGKLDAPATLTTSAGASACESPGRRIQPGSSARFTIVPALVKAGKRYKFDISATPTGASAPTVFDPELIIDSPTGVLPTKPRPTHR